jgi:hypothetical protein
MGVDQAGEATLSLIGSRFVRNATISNYEFVNNDLMFGVSGRFLTWVEGD